MLTVNDSRCTEEAKHMTSVQVSETTEKKLQAVSSRTVNKWVCNNLQRMSIVCSLCNVDPGSVVRASVSNIDLADSDDSIVSNGTLEIFTAELSDSEIKELDDKHKWDGEFVLRAKKLKAGTLGNAGFTGGNWLLAMTLTFKGDFLPHACWVSL